MIGECLEKGDTALIAIPQENREWGYNPAPDGTLVTIQGFGEIHYGYINNYGNTPGVYQNRCWADVRLPNGEMIHLSTLMLNPLDPASYQVKADAFRARLKSGSYKDQYRLRDLPDTKLWPGDHVFNNRSPNYQEMRVVGIKYEYLGQKSSDGVTDMPLYDVSSEFPAGWHTAANESDLDLLARGNVWKYYHQEPMSFASLGEEAHLFKMLGRTREVRNPANGMFCWTKDQVLDAIEQGTAHGISVSGSLFGNKDQAYLFLDEELGKRVAEETLRGFGRIK